HVFDEMGNAAFVPPFVAGSRPDPDAEGNGAESGHLLGDDAQAVVQPVVDHVDPPRMSDDGQADSFLSYQNSSARSTVRQSSVHASGSTIIRSFNRIRMHPSVRPDRHSSERSNESSARPAGFQIFRPLDRIRVGPDSF